MQLYKTAIAERPPPPISTHSQPILSTSSLNSSGPNRFSFYPQQPRDALKGKLISKLFQRSASEESGNIQRALDSLAAAGGAGAESALHGPARSYEEQVEVFKEVYEKVMVFRREERRVTFVTKPMLGEFSFFLPSSFELGSMVDAVDRVLRPSHRLD
jgi:hypothetical protein